MSSHTIRISHANPLRRAILVLALALALTAAVAAYFAVSNSAGADSITLLPNGDRSNDSTGWERSGGTDCGSGGANSGDSTCSSDIDEDVDTGATADVEYIQTEATDPSNDDAEFNFGDPLGSTNQISQIVVRFRARWVDASGTDTPNLQVSLRDAADNSLGSVTLTNTLTTSFADYSFTVNTTLSQAEGDGIYVRLRADGNRRIQVSAVNLDLTYSTVTPNPPLASSCGIDMVLVIDSSGSIDDAELTTMKNAYNQFVAAFLPETPTQIGIVEFDTTTVAVQGFTNVEATLNTAIGNATSGGFTNWEDGLQDARALFPGRVGVPDLIVFASDGNPNTVIGGGGGSTAEPAAVLAAVGQANLAKAAGIRIISLGIGSDLDQSNLESVSSEDAYYASGFNNLATTLADLAKTLCGGTITVHKIIDADGDPATTSDQTNGANWSFTASVDTTGANADDSVTAPATALTDVNGQHNFAINLGGNATSTAQVVETPQAGFTFKSASCTGSPNPGTPSGNGVSGIVLGPNDIVNCTFYNQPAATFTVHKVWSPASGASVNVTVSCTGGATVTGGTQAVSTASPKNWTVSNFVGNPTCTATENPIPTGYTANGNPAGTCSAALLAPAGSCTITNTRNDTTFVVNKTWIPASIAGVSVTVSCPGATVVEGAQTVTTAAPKTWNVQGYTVGVTTCTATETPIPAGYTASGNPPGTCAGVLGAQGGSCTITNSLNSTNFTVNKVWAPDPSAASVSVSIVCTPPATAAPAGSQNVTSGSPGVWVINNFTVGVTSCTATENPIPAGYTANGAPAGTCSGLIGAQGGNCTITNTRNDALFTVVKVWSPASAASVQVTVTCTPPATAVEGAQAVFSGPGTVWHIHGYIVGTTCTATEVIPAGYTASGAPAGSCTAGVPAPGTCTITNTRNDTTFTVNKVWVPASISSVSVTIQCTGGGNVVEAAQNVTTAAPATWHIQGYITNPTCTATENPIPAGYTASGAPAGTCLGSAPNSCTITNTRNDTTFIVHKDWSPASGASVNVTIQCTGGGTIVEGTQAVSTASPKTWHIQGYITQPTCTATESPIPAGYTATGNPPGTCSNPAPGECTITNRRNDTTFTVHKVWSPASGASVSVTVQCTGGGTVVEGAQNVSTASPATWNIQGYITQPTCTATENPIPAGYTASGNPAGTCSNQAPGECTITNTQTSTDFRVTKDFVPDLAGGTVLVHLSCAGATTSADQPAGETPLVTPSFTVTGFSDPTTTLCTATETNVPAGYAVSQCQAMLSVGTCKITNVKLGTIVVEKTTNPADPQSFVVEMSGTASANGAITDATDQTFPGLQPGTYTIKEYNVSGWRMDGVICNGGNPSQPVVVPGVSTAVTITVNYGDLITCTYTNTKLGTVIVKKTTIPAGDATVFPVDLTGQAAASGSVTDATDQIFPNLDPGHYVVSETLTPPWVMISLSCPPSTEPVIGNSQGFTLPAGGTIVCTFTNQTQATFDVYKDWVNETKADTVSVSVTCDTGQVAPGSANASESVPASFTVTGFSGSPDCTATESAIPTGYVSSGTCTADLLNPGECTISNTLRTGDFQVIKNFVPDPNDPNVATSVTLSCNSGNVTNNPQPANDTTTANFTVQGHNGPGTICTATENLVPGYNADGNPPGTCQGTLDANSHGSCTITNTLVTADFEVRKDFSDDSLGSVPVTLTCGSGQVSPPSGFASEASPAQFTVSGFTGDPMCTGTETSVPLGYSSSVTCSALLSEHFCTITNTKREGTFTVYKDFEDDSGAGVTVFLTCNENTVVTPPSAQVFEGQPFTFILTGFASNPFCTATEVPIPAGYISTGQCQARMSVGECTIFNGVPTPTPSPTPSPTPTQATETPTATPTATPVVTPVTPTVTPATQTPTATPTTPPTNTPEPTPVTPTIEPATNTPVITDPPTNPPTNSPSPTALPATQTPKATPTALPVTQFPNTGSFPLTDNGNAMWLLFLAGLMAIAAGACFTVVARKR